MIQILPDARRPRSQLRAKPNRFTSSTERIAIMEVKNISVEQYIKHLCRLIVREGDNRALRCEYEKMLSQLRNERVQLHV
nr:hypothetical protein [uncultured Deefgea sp.]